MFRDTGLVCLRLEVFLGTFEGLGLGVNIKGCIMIEG